MQKFTIAFLLFLVIGLSLVIFNLTKSETSNDSDQLVDRVFHTDKMIVTIQNRSHLQLSLAIETDSKKSKSELQKAYPLFENKMIHSLSTLDKQAIQSKEGIELIEATIMEGINPFLSTGEIKNVYVTEKVLQ
jgi:flagellar FliL protein